MGTGRLEAFSDGVIAVAITLLVLQISVPVDLHGHGLAHALLANWSQYVAYVVSFATIGIIWINHHVMLSRLREADHSILMLNLLLLLTIAVLPFATDLIAAYLRRPTGHTAAAVVYAGSFLAMAVVFGSLNRLILMHRPQLLRVELTLGQRRQILRSAVAGTLPYVAALGFAFVSAYVTVAICAAVGVYYALPTASRQHLGSERRARD